MTDNDRINPVNDQLLSRPSTGASHFVAFVTTSGISAAVNLLLRYFFSRLVFFEAAVSLSYVVSTALAFLLARGLVFGPGKDRWQAELGRFVLVNILGFLQVLAISAGLVRAIFPVIGLRWHPEEIGHFVGLASLALTSYWAHKHFTFRPAESTGPVSGAPS